MKSWSRTWLKMNLWQESLVQFTAYLPSLIHCSAVLRLLQKSTAPSSGLRERLLTTKPTRGNNSFCRHSTFACHSPGTLPAPCLILEVMVGDDGLPGWAPHRPLQQMLDFPLQDIVDRQPNGLEKTALFQVAVDLGLRKGSISSELPAYPSPFIASHDRL